MKCGGKKCIYRTGAGEPGVSGKCDMTCNYALITGKTKLGQIYEQYGITNYDQRAAKILGRIKCPFYSPGDRIRQSRTELLLHGSKPGKYDWARGRALYEKGMSDRKIAQALGAHPESVRKWRGREGLPPNSGGGAGGRGKPRRGRFFAPLRMTEGVRREDSSLRSE